MKPFNKARSIAEYFDVPTLAEEYLNVYIFGVLVHDKKDSVSFTPEDYIGYSLTDTIVNSFNEETKKNGDGIQRIESYISDHRDEANSFIKNFGNVFPPKPIVWESRHHVGYYKDKLQESFSFEIFVYMLLYSKGVDLKPYYTEEGQNSGENELGVEIKNDTLIKNTGNIYIEYMEKSAANKAVYVKSGILKDDNTRFFIIGEKQAFWILRKSDLRNIFNEEFALHKADKPSKRGVRFVTIYTSGGMLLPKGEADKIKLTLDTLIDELK